MRNKLFTLITVMFLLIASQPAWAAYIELQTDTDPALLGVGDTFGIDIYLYGEAGDGVINGSYRFDIGFDSAELALHALSPLSATEVLPSGFTDIKPLSFNSTENTVEWFDGFSFGSVSLSSPIYYGNIEFDVLNPIADGSDDFWVTYVTGAGITIDMVIEQPSSIGTDISAVPIPGALVLLGSGLLGFAGIRRRRSA
jgi:hypothetical protein